MQLPKGALVAVVDGEKFNLFRNTADGPEPQLSAETHGAIDADQHGSSMGHRSSAANPSDSQQDEDGFAFGVAEFLNKQALEGKISDLVVIAAPRTLGELRKHYHKSLSAILLKEISKDLAGRPTSEVAAAVAAA